MQCEVETITPAIAQQMLEHNDTNRPLKKGHIKRLADSMKAGDWRLNGETIKLNGEELIDGQHRLWAVISSNTPIKSYVIRGIRKDAFDSIDIGKVRTVADTLARDGMSHYNALAGAMKTIQSWKAKNFKLPKMTPAEAHRLLAECPGLEDSLAFVHELDLRGMVGAGAATGLHWMMAQSSRGKADSFWLSLSTGEQLTKSSPVYLLRELMRRNTGVHKLSWMLLQLLTVKAWNSYVTGRPIKILKWQGDEQVPDIK